MMILRMILRMLLLMMRMIAEYAGSERGLLVPVVKSPTVSPHFHNRTLHISSTHPLTDTDTHAKTHRQTHTKTYTHLPPHFHNHTLH